MPKESVIRKKVIDRLSKGGWICWYPFKARYAKEVDIFGVFDIFAVHAGGKIKLIQLTNYANVSNRIKKVTTWLEKNQISPEAFGEKLDGANVVSMEVWGWNPKKKEFRIVRL